MILAYTAWNFETGYAHHGRSFFTRLNRRIPVRVITGGGDPSILTDEERALLSSPIESKNLINIILQTHDHPIYWQNFTGPKIAFCVWESTRYKDTFFQQLLKFDQLWVPSEWQKQCSIEQGFPEDRVFVVREGVDGDYFKPGVYENRGKFQFLHFGRWDYRKSTEELIKAFIEEFDGENVELVLSIDSSFPIDGEVLRTEDRLQKKNLLHPQLRIVHFLPRSEYLTYLQTGNCLVTCARAEGWNLPLCEAMACGIPTICSDYGAQLEFAEGVAHKVKIKGLVPTKNILFQPDGIGEWAEPDFDDLKVKMRYVYENYDDCKKFALEKSKYIRDEFSWDKPADKAFQILKNSEKTFQLKPKEDRIIVAFNDKPKVEILGDSDVTYHVEFIDQDTSFTIHQGDIKPNHWIVTNRRYFTNWLVKISHEGRLLFEKKFDPVGKRVYIGLDSKSLGDTIAWIPYAVEFKKKWNCHVIVSTFWNHLFEDVYPELEFIKPGEVIHNLYAGYYIGVRDNDYNSNQNNWKTVTLQKVATDYLGLDYEEIRPRVKKFRPDNYKEINKPYVAISEFSTAQAKFWNFPGGWQTIVNYLKSKGYDVVSVSKEETKLQGVIKCNNRPIEETIANISGADFFIGIGSGLSWLAWALDVPVILISGFSAPWCEFKDCIRIHPGRGCHSCFNDKDLLFDRGNWLWCPRSKNFECSRNITPEMVIEGINKVIEKKRVLITSKSVQPPTGRTGLLKALEILDSQMSKITIVEVGMTRQEGNWKGDGYSTPLFAWYVENKGGWFYSFDIDPEAIKVSKRIMSYYGIEGKHTTLICADALSFFKRNTFLFPGIDLLYLDAVDYSNENKEFSQQWHLEFFKLVESYLNNRALIVIDDIFDEEYTGKGKLLIPYMLNKGYKIIEKGYQVILKISEYKQSEVRLSASL